MGYCSNCPHRENGTPCPALTRPHPRYCQLLDPSHPAYNPEYRPIVAEGDGGPGLVQMAGNLAAAAARFVGSGLKVAPPEVQAERKAACFACDEFHDHARDRCRKCGCTAMNTKRSWASSVCPDTPPRWTAV